MYVIAKNDCDHLFLREYRSTCRYNLMMIKSMRLTIIPFLFLLILTACSKQKKGIKAEYRNVTEAVYSTATVQPRNVYKVYPQLSGIIDKIMIAEGDEVKEGDLLLKIIDNKSEVNVENAQLKYEIAKESYSGESARLKEIEEQISTARVRVKNDSINYMRQKRLWEKNVGSRLEFEQKELAFDVSKNDLASLLNNYKRTKAELQRQMEIAKNTVQINKLNSDDFNLKSKMNGLVYSVQKEEGESVTPQTVVAIIGSKADFILSLLIDEVDIRKVFEGQKIVLTLDAYPDTVYQARVAKIFPEKDERSLTFKVEAKFVTRPERLLKGLSGEANIVISEKQNVLSLPSQYITEDNKVNTEDGPVMVQTGLRSLDFTEIISGIDSSTVIKSLE